MKPCLLYKKNCEMSILSIKQTHESQNNNDLKQRQKLRCNIELFKIIQYTII